MRVLKTPFLTQGPEIEKFEKEFARFCGAKHAVAVCNATGALHLAMRVLGIGPGDRVVTSPNTFLASANAAAYVGAVPDFSDIDPIFANLDPAELERTWKADTKAVVAVDYAGVPCNMPEIARIAREQGAYVIEDACHGVGGGFSAAGKKWKLGSHPYADITTFSFHAVKTITTGEGGILVTENDEWATKARLLRSHGVMRDSAKFVGLTDSQSSGLDPLFLSLAEKGPWYYEMQDLGYNYRITDIQCALGRSQLKNLPKFIRRRREIVAQYNEGLSNLDWLRIPSFTNNHQQLAMGSKFTFELSDLSLHLYTVKIDFGRLKKSRAKVMQELWDMGVGSQVLYIPVHLQPWYRANYNYSAGKSPRAEEFYLSALSLPFFPSLSEDKVKKITTNIRKLGR